MAQIVIFAPEGEDVSAGETALRDAGHEVEVVEASPENLLHMAIGMMEHGGSSEPKEEPEEDPLAEPASDGEPEEEDPKKMESLGTCMVDGEKVAAKKGKKTRLYVKELHEGDKLTFTINESVISTWDRELRFFLTAPNGEMSGARATINRSKFEQTYLEVGPEFHHLF